MNNHNAFKFGLYERVLGTALTLVIWATVMVLLVTTLSEHGTPSPELASVVKNLANGGIIAIMLLFWGRPLATALGRGYRHVRTRLRGERA